MPSGMDFERSSGEAQWLDSKWFDASRTGNAPELPAAFPEQTPAQAKALRREKFLVGACLLVALAGSVLALVACTGEPFEQDMERITMRAGCEHKLDLGVRRLLGSCRATAAGRPDASLAHP